jgi:PhnB protein
MTIEPYLNFNGRAEEAIAFYEKALGATVEMLMRFKESPVPTSPESADKVMHASLKIGNSRLMLSDGHNTGTAKFEGINLSATLATDAETEKAFAALADGGKVQLSPHQTFFASRFGMVTDRFGITWMVITHR